MAEVGSAYYGDRVHLCCFYRRLPAHRKPKAKVRIVCDKKMWAETWFTGSLPKLAHTKADLGDHVTNPIRVRVLITTIPTKGGK